MSIRATACRLIDRAKFVWWSRRYHKRCLIDDKNAWYAMEKPVLWAHAGGGRLGIYSNSKEAVADSIARGFKAIEIDVALTADNVPVLSHRFCPCNKEQYEQTPTLAEFLAMPIDGRFTPMTLQGFFEAFRSFDGYAVIDSYFMYKGDGLFDLPGYIENNVTRNQLGRIIYSVPSLESMVALAKRGHGFASLHYALPVNLDDGHEFWRLPYFVRILTSCNVRSVSMGDREITGKTRSVIKAFRDVGIHVSVAGINDIKKCNEWIEAGAMYHS